MIAASVAQDEKWAKSLLLRLSDIQSTLTKSLSAPVQEDGRPRTPPPPPTDIQFPHYQPQGQPASELQPDLTLQDLYGRPVRTPFFVTRQHIQALNLQVEQDVPLEQLLPNNHLPPLSWHINVGQCGDCELPATNLSSERLGNGGAAPGCNMFQQRMKELSVDNEDAFRIIQRMPPRSPKPLPPIKIAHFRKFYESLLAMAEYWDTSLDQYHTDISNWAYVESDVIEERVHANSRKENPSDTSLPKPKITYTGRRRGTGSDMPERIREDMVRGFIEPIAWSFGCRLESPRQGVPPRLKMHNLLLSIKQSGTGYRAPRDRQRAKMGILEGPLFGIQCRHETRFSTVPRNDTTEKCRNLQQPTCEIEKKPGGEGPGGVGGVAVGNFTKEGEGKEELLDLAREVGAMLLIAQERAREGQTEDKLEDRWWAKEPTPKPIKSQPDVHDATNSTDGASRIASSNPNLETGSGWKHIIPNDRQKREIRSHCYTLSKLDNDIESLIGTSKPYKKQRRELNSHPNMSLKSGPPTSLWNQKISYQRIGKEAESQVDDIYLITSLNHHISILHLAVPHQYISYLTDLPHSSHPPTTLLSETLANDPSSPPLNSNNSRRGSAHSSHNIPIPFNEPWYILQMRRSRWYDMLNPEDRMEALRGVWGVLGWLNRDICEKS